VSDQIPAPDASELDSLLGAYALDALDDTDRARVDAYLRSNAAARAEVDEMRETAASLALLPSVPTDTPPEMWERIADSIAADREQDAPAAGGDELAARRARRTRVAWTGAAAVAAAIAIVVLAAQVSSLNRRLDRQQVGPTAMAAAFDRAAGMPGAREVGLQSESGATLARVVLLPDGAGYLRGDDLAPLPASKTYQLWAVTGSPAQPTVVSAGVLGPDPSALGFHASGPVRAFAVTVEQAGGVVASTQKPVARGALA
jgi:anti-sigma-K factor RskA